MTCSGRKKLGLKFLAIGLSFALALPGFASELKSARIYPTGKITIYSGDQRVGEFSKEAPFPEGFLIAADGKCGVKMEHIYLVAEDRSLFSVATSANPRKLLVKEGTVYFAISKMSHPLSFITPSGSVAVLDILLNAATVSSPLKGYVSVKQNRSELGIIKGGSMIVSTQQGEMMIESGQRLILAQADLDVGAPEEIETSDEKEGQEEKTGKEEKPGMSKNQKIIVGAIGVVAVAVGIGALAGGGGGGAAGCGVAAGVSIDARDRRGIHEIPVVRIDAGHLGVQVVLLFEQILLVIVLGQPEGCGRLDRGRRRLRVVSSSCRHPPGRPPTRDGRRRRRPSGRGCWR